MSTLKALVSQSGKTMTAAAGEIGVSLQDLSHFIRGETEKVGKEKYDRICDWMAQKGLQPPREREVCTCSKCGARHVKGKNSSLTKNTVSLVGKNSG